MSITLKVIMEPIILKLVSSKKAQTSPTNDLKSSNEIRTDGGHLAVVDTLLRHNETPTNFTSIINSTSTSKKDIIHHSSLINMLNPSRQESKLKLHKTVSKILIRKFKLRHIEKLLGKSKRNKQKRLQKTMTSPRLTGIDDDLFYVSSIDR